MTTDETAISQQICPTCPLESCNDRSPECPLRAHTRQSDERERERQRAYYLANRDRKIEAAKRRQREKTVKRYTAEERREYFRDYKRLRKAREVQSV